LGTVENSDHVIIIDRGVFANQTWWLVPFISIAFSKINAHSVPRQMSDNALEQFGVVVELILDVLVERFEGLVLDICNVALAEAASAECGKASPPCHVKNYDICHVVLQVIV
jgi:hypothetical protein